MKQSFIPVILAGGKGERFWPRSRQQRPKQFLCLDGSGKSLIQATAERLLPLAEGWQGLWVVTAAQFADIVHEELPLLPVENLLIEPQGRDTAPAVTWTVLEISRRYGEDTVIGFFPADHWIGNDQIFQQTVAAAQELTYQEPAIVTLGIQPSYPATGYGYIEQGQCWGQVSSGNLSVYQVKRFTEKPEYGVAAKFVSSGRYSWNGGIFVFQAKTALTELQRYAPQIYQPLVEKGMAAYSELPKISIDYALMEKTQQAYVLPVTFPWDDLGDWNALERLCKYNGTNGNNENGGGENSNPRPNVEFAQHFCIDTCNTILSSSDPDELIVTMGLEDLVIVRDGKVTLVVRKDRTQDIKQVLQHLRTDPRYSHLL
uniref:Mannose-1-phosphate guanylyltransferase (GDP) n=1 Tax=Cyanothece sp. (strain PCC 7425 / ATCC 29141) TaxID=395961 RepID=B8HRR3_CYAP4